MSYFYARAREQAAEPYGGLETADGRKAADGVDVRKYRHGGPKPQSREAAIIMLADSVEASVRSLSSRDEPAIRAMVARIFEERISDDQFDECDLTLRDIEMIREAFVGQLLGMYHQRVAYPQNKVVELESRRAAGGDGQGTRA
jgi:membrane-associated HD superfamily phosphohydrolase